jgi:hypothetical protein
MKTRDDSILNRINLFPPLLLALATPYSLDALDWVQRSSAPTCAGNRPQVTGAISASDQHNITGGLWELPRCVIPIYPDCGKLDLNGISCV